MNKTVENAIRETTRLQALAADPLGSRWVSANAGTGKTHVLVQRVLQLLLAGARADTILCLTYTNAAAAEMENRLFASLAAWAVMSEDKLAETLTALLKRPLSADDYQTARTLFATTLETAGGLKVQTIHAFCERLLRRFPLEADISPNSTLLDDAASRELKKESIEKVLRRAAKNPDGYLGRALATVIAFTSEEGFSGVIEEALGKRNLLKEIRAKDEAGKDPFGDAVARLYESFGVSREDSPAELRTQLANVLADSEIETLYEVLNQGKASDIATAESLMRARHGKDERERADGFRQAFYTKSNPPTPKKRLFTKGVQEAAPALMERLAEAQEQFSAIWQRSRALRVVRASDALLRFSSEILQAYTSAKVTRAQLDFDDLIEKTNWLLGKSGGASWVLFKLDSGLDHILVDEAQDTSPDQWRLISHLTDEFFVGKGAHEHDALARTVFAVGDEKQSIYSFQGAQPAEFARMREKMEEQAGRIGHDLPLIPLTLSFRSTPAVLNSVDLVFADREATPGLTFGNEDIHHGAMRANDPGHVEIWDLEQAEVADRVSVWTPHEDLGKTVDPKEKLAERIATTIRGWLDDDRLLPSKERAIEPGDILILVRKRHPFTQPMIRALKRLDIPVAGADRMKVAEQIAVEDLMALGDFLLLPENDLALATVLKSPLFALDDDDLFLIRRDPLDSDLFRAGRDNIKRPKNIPLWWAMKAARDKGKDERISKAYEQLARWMMRADKVPPYELFAGILDINGGREKLTSRQGSEAGDALNEFLSMALAFDDNAPPSLQAFLNQVRSTDSEVKRDMEKGVNEVRIMTVHGAKGLESEIVFMPDTTSTRSSTRSGKVQSLAMENAPDGTPASLVWCVPGSKDVPQVQTINDEKARKDREEYNRLLYVAMTRARDQLYICGWLGRGQLEDKSWYARIKQGLDEYLMQSNDDAGYKVWRFEPGGPHEAGQAETSPTTDEIAPPPLPAWIDTDAPGQPKPARTLSPSSLIPHDLADNLKEAQPLDALDFPTGEPAFDSGRQRGILIHALLQYLPDIPDETWPQAIDRVLSSHALDAASGAGAEIAREALAVLTHDEFVPLFGEGSIAEPAFNGPLGMGSSNRLSGQIDRLVVTQNDVQIIDYKTNLQIPAIPQEAPLAYQAQLAAYRLPVRTLFPGKAVRCALLWTRKPTLMWLPDKLLDQVEATLPDLVQKTR